MSHVAKIELEIQDLSILKQACQRLGLEFRENQTTYKWYGRWVGTQPLPPDLTPADLGTCDHAIRVPGARYEIGVIKRQGSYQLLWDNWHEGGLADRLGPEAGLLKQAYAIERVRQEATLKGYRLQEKKLPHAVQLTITL